MEAEAQAEREPAAVTDDLFMWLGCSNLSMGSEYLTANEPAIPAMRAEQRQILVAMPHPTKSQSLCWK